MSSLQIQPILPPNQNPKNFIIEWNYRFPVDRWWRQKYNVAFGSKKHLEISQLQIILEYLEEKTFEEFVDLGEVRREKEKNYKKGLWLVEVVSKEDEDDLFDKIVL